MTQTKYIEKDILVHIPMYPQVSITPDDFPVFKPIVSALPKPPPQTVRVYKSKNKARPLRKKISICVEEKK